MNNHKPLGDMARPPVFKKQQVLGKRPLRHGSQQQPAGPRDPFGPPPPPTTAESKGPQEELLRKQSEEYNLRQAMKAAMAHAKATSNGFFVAKPSRHENLLIPAIPRPAGSL